MMTVTVQALQSWRNESWKGRPEEKSLQASSENCVWCL